MRLATLAAAALLATTPLSAQTLAQDGSFDGGFALLGTGTRFDAFSLVLDAKDRPVVAFGQAASGRVFSSIRRLAPDGAAETGFDALPGTDYFSVRLLSLQDEGVLALGARAPGGDITVPPVGYAVRYAEDGTLDAGFTAGDLAGTSEALGAAETPDGFVLSVRAPDATCALIGLTAAGAPDAGFTSTPLYGGAPCSGARVARDADGGLVVASSVTRATSVDLEITRVLADGTLDASFGTGGVTRLDFEDGDESVGTLAVLDDGRILVAANAQKGAIAGKLVVRLAADGQRDAGFGADGLVLLAGNRAAAPDFSGPADAFADDDGAVTVLGTEDARADGGLFTSTAVRLLPDGDIDSAFGDAGYDRFRDIYLTIDGPFEQRQVARDGEGRILFTSTSGRTNTRAVFVGRYVEAGSVAGEAAPTADIALRTFPNPAASRTTITVTLPAPAALTVTVHDALGRQVARLADGAPRAGTASLDLDASKLAPGVYLVRVVADGAVQTTRISVVR